MKRWNEVLGRILEDFPTPKIAVEAERSHWLSQVQGDVLEVGFGSGLNLPHLSSRVVEFVGLDPEPVGSEMAKARIARVSFPILLIKATGENIPFEDASFDSAICTWTLCTVQDPAKVLREISRVLKPEGRFFFIEHGASPRKGLKRLQDAWNPLQTRIADGCNINRPIPQLLEEAGFQMREFVEGGLPGPKVLTYTYRGIAEKKRGK